MKRVIQKNILNPLAVKMLDGEVKDGTAVKVVVQDGALILSPSEVAEVEEPAAVNGETPKDKEKEKKKKNKL